MDSNGIQFGLFVCYFMYDRQYYIISVIIEIYSLGQFPVIWWECVLKYMYFLNNFSSSLAR